MLRQHCLFCFIVESLNKTTDTSCQMNFTTSPTPSSPSSFMSLCFSLSSLSALTSYTNTTHPYFPPWLHSCSFIPRGEEQTPIITQVSVKWIIGRLIELHDGKHPSWVVRLSVLRPLPHLSADAQGWHVCILIATAERERVWSATAACCTRIPDSWQGNLVIMNALT